MSKLPFTFADTKAEPAPSLRDAFEDMALDALCAFMACAAAACLGVFALLLADALQ